MLQQILTGTNAKTGSFEIKLAHFDKPELKVLDLD